jgi:hypothetical protein
MSALIIRSSETVAHYISEAAQLPGPVRHLRASGALRRSHATFAPGMNTAPPAFGRS